METNRVVNRLKFETFKKRRSKSFLVLPTWFNEAVYNSTLAILNDNISGKLHACKYLVDISKQKNTRDHGYGLQWAKTEIVDPIESIGLGATLREHLFVPTPTITPIASSPTKEEIIRTLKPFMALANECLRNSSLNKDQVVYAYNHATITMQDLRNVEAIMKKLY